MEEYRQEEEEYEEIIEEESDVVEEEDEANKAETADLQRMFRQHPEIWIPYEEQVQERLLPKGPDDSNHRTYPLMTRYEITKVISFRASQLCNGAKPYILIPEGVTDAYQIAKMELQAKRLPYILKRPLPNGTYEYWRLADLLLVE